MRTHTTTYSLKVIAADYTSLKYRTLSCFYSLHFISVWDKDWQILRTLRAVCLSHMHMAVEGFFAQTCSQQQHICRIIQVRGGAAGCSRQRQEVTYLLRCIRRFINPYPVVEVSFIPPPWPAVAQEVEWVVHKPEGRWFDPLRCQSTCWSDFGRDTEPHITSDGSG